MVERVDLLGDGDDVLVVRQHDDLVGVDRLDRVEDLRGRRVHRLAAGDHALHAELAEQLGQPVAAGDRDDRGRDRGQAERGTGVAAAPRIAASRTRVLLVDLLEQVGDPDLLRAAVRARAPASIAAPMSLVCTWQFHRPVAADDDDRVADLAPRLLERLDVLVERGRGSTSPRSAAR